MLRATNTHDADGIGEGRSEACAKDPPTAHPHRALDEPKTEGSGTTRVVAKSNHAGLLNPNRRRGFVRLASVGQLTRATGTPQPSNASDVRRQRLGRFGQRRSSEPTQVHAGGQQASRRGMQRAETCQAKLTRLNKPAIEQSKSRTRRSWCEQRTCMHQATR